MAPATYQYDKIPTGKWFRQLLITPGERDDPIHCTLVTTAMDEAPAYTALSYVWGDPTKLGTLTCGGYPRPATLSLIGGLSQLRHPTETKVVWADAICINQADNAEKAHQVNMMGEIYDEAAEVFVWFGDDPDQHARHAFECLSSANKAILTGSQRRVEIEDTITVVIEGQDESARGTTTVSRENMSSVISDRQLEALLHLYRLPWFTRVWVLQEVGLATKATACWGDCRIDFSEIGLFVWFANNDHDLSYRIGAEGVAVLSGCPYSAVYGVWSTYNKKNGWIHASGPLKVWADHLASECNVDFLLVLEASKTFNATDARDHIFAFLGHPHALLPNTKKPLVTADYENDLDHLYRRVAENLATVSLNFLVHAQNTTESLACDDKLSWVPRWDSNIENAPHAMWEAWDASLRISRQYDHPVRISGHKLGVSAILLDTVGEQTEVFTAPDLDDGSARIGYWIEECWNMTERAAETVPHKYAGHHVLALASTMTAQYTSKVLGQDFETQCIGSFSQACIHYNGSFYEKNLQGQGFWYPWGVLQHRQFVTRFRHAACNRRFFISKGGYWGLGPAAMQQGDVCAVLMGGDVPFILRPGVEKGTFRLVGQAYIYGIMYGEAIEQSERGSGVGEEEIFIV